MIRRHSCVTIECDTCETDVEMDGGGAIHFEDVGDATAFLSALGWDIRPDGHATCGQCTTVEDVVLEASPS